MCVCVFFGFVFFLLYNEKVRSGYFDCGIGCNVEGCLVGVDLECHTGRRGYLEWSLRLPCGRVVDMCSMHILHTTTITTTTPSLPVLVLVVLLLVLLALQHYWYYGTNGAGVGRRDNEIHRGRCVRMCVLTVCVHVFVSLFVSLSRADPYLCWLHVLPR